MTHGLEIFNPAGVLVCSVTNRLARVLGTQTVAGEGVVGWPYPAIPGGQRQVGVISNGHTANFPSIAYATLSPDQTLIHYSQADDTAPITLLYMTF